MRAGAVAWTLLLAGCLGGQTGGELTGGPATSEDDSACEPQLETIGVEEISPLGVSAAQALMRFGGAHGSALLWAVDTDPVTYGPERGESRIDLTLSYRGAPVRFVHFVSPTPETGAAGGGAADLPVAPSCEPDRLEIDVAVELRTSGGALSEGFDATLRVQGPELASLSKQLELGALMGSFSVSVPEGYATDELGIDIAFAPGSVRGQLTGVVFGSEAVSERDKFAIQIVYAEWPP